MYPPQYKASFLFVPLNLGENSFRNVIYLKLKHWLAALAKKYMATVSPC